MLTSFLSNKIVNRVPPAVLTRASTALPLTRKSTSPPRKAGNSAPTSPPPPIPAEKSDKTDKADKSEKNDKSEKPKKGGSHIEETKKVRAASLRDTVSIDNLVSIQFFLITYPR